MLTNLDFIANAALQRLKRYYRLWRSEGKLAYKAMGIVSHDRLLAVYAGKGTPHLDRSERYSYSEISINKGE